MDINKYPKVLVISHNAFSETLNNGKTYSSIFSDWPKDNIAQLFFQNEIPNFSVCSNYFKISDEEILLQKKHLVGKKVVLTNAAQIKKTNSKFHKFARKYPISLFGFARDLIWSSKKWDNENLNNWVKSFSPEVIFFVGGGSSFSYTITNKIAKTYKLPVYLYYTDDYITPIVTLDPFWWLNWLRLRSNLAKCLHNVEKVFVIGEDMAKEYSKKLNKPCIPIMNAIDIDKYSQVNSQMENTVNDTEFSLAYFGGLHLNRWKSIAALGKVIKTLSDQHNLSISLSIYTNQKPDEKTLRQIHNEPYIKYVGSVEASEIINEMNKYDGLVHVESFELKMKQKTRLSISTKIPEYMASGKPIIAVGPKDISSMRYIASQKNAYIINSLDKESIIKQLTKMVSEKELHIEIGKKNINLARKNHSIEKNREIIKWVLFELFEEKESTNITDDRR